MGLETISRVRKSKLQLVFLTVYRSFETVVRNEQDVRAKPN
jgi:hypothetical protein